jgi:hypothetical protein
LVWKHLKADTVGRTSITNFADFRTMLSFQRSPAKIRSCFQKPSLKYAARCAVFAATMVVHFRAFGFARNGP